MVQVSSLASSSSGNAYFLEANKSCFLIDAGIGIRDLDEKLHLLGKRINAIDAVFITHEHIDHVRAVPQLARLDVPIFMSNGTYNALGLKLRNFVPICAGQEIAIKDIRVKAFEKFHDSAEPLGFSILCGETHACFATDLGKCSSSVKEEIGKSNFLLLESNHDIEMLKSGPYPIHLKRRILSSLGHLSNEDSALAVLENANSRLEHIMLAHLSEINNRPEIALLVFRTLLNERCDLKPKIIVCPKDKISTVRL
ncbi:MAG: MBL fold metallo-hydrolase [Candidatus Woesearchaeota archaeon]